MKKSTLFESILQESSMKEARIPCKSKRPVFNSTECVLKMCSAFKNAGLQSSDLGKIDSIRLKIRGDHEDLDEFENIGLSEQKALDYCDSHHCNIEGVKIIKGNDVIYTVWFGGKEKQPISWNTELKFYYKLDSFMSYTKEEFESDLEEVIAEVKKI
jgi:hypothetical protein